MKPTISFSLLNLFFALTLPNLHAQPITEPTQPSAVSSETQGKLTAKLNHVNSTQDPKIESHGRNATAGHTSSPTMTAFTTSTAKETTTTARSFTTQNAYESSTALNTKVTTPRKAIPTTKANERSDRTGVGIAAATLAVLLVICVIVFRWLTRQTGPAGDRARRCLHSLQEQLRTAIGALERCLGLRLWPRKRIEEDGGEEEVMNGSNGTAGARKVEEGEKDEEDQREEDGDSSDDYSSLEGMDLRERARQKQEEERPEEGEESKTEGDEEDLTSIALGEEDKEGEDDVTEL